MTAEVAILNKSAVALAADSAVSIGRPGNRKIYNTVNKIFELSHHRPVGIMIYGRLDFMGLPFETIIKEYRYKLGKRTFPYILDYRDDFCNYLANNIKVTDHDEASNCISILYDAFLNANAEVDSLILESIIGRGKFLKSKVNQILQGHIRREISKLKAIKFAEGFSTKAINPLHEAGIDWCMSACFKSVALTETSKVLIREFAGYLLAKEQLSEIRTGIVTAGFGELDFCPSLDNIEIDGIVGGKFKHVKKPYVDIGRHQIEADILGFAQDDMVKSFLNGIDPVFEDYVKSAVQSAIEQSTGLLLEMIIADNNERTQLKNGLSAELSNISNLIKKSLDDYVTKYSSKPIRDMIRSMPKQELASLASSLIEITSLKRKVTREQETVGGPVDVAIISKSEGFVWVKRKHYFPAELNRRFFVRHFGENGGPNGSAETEQVAGNGQSFEDR